MRLSRHPARLALGAAAASGLLTTVILCGCGSASTAGTAGSSGHPAVPSASPSTSRRPAAPSEAAHRRRLVIVRRGFDVSGLILPGACRPGQDQQGTGVLLSVRCTTAGYLYTARRPGIAYLAAAVRPHCAFRTACPEWIAVPRLRVVISR